MVKSKYKLNALDLVDILLIRWFQTKTVSKSLVKYVAK